MVRALGRGVYGAELSLPATAGTRLPTAGGDAHRGLGDYVVGHDATPQKGVGNDEFADGAEWYLCGRQPEERNLHPDIEPTDGTRGGLAALGHRLYDEAGATRGDAVSQPPI